MGFHLIHNSRLLLWNVTVDAHSNILHSCIFGYVTLNNSSFNLQPIPDSLSDQYHSAAAETTLLDNGVEEHLYVVLAQKYQKHT